MGKSSEKEEFWRLVIEEYSSSGLTGRAFCQREGISEPSFYAWRRKLRDRDAAFNGGSATEPGKLIPVDIIDSSVQRASSNAQAIGGCDEQAMIEVTTPCGFTVRVTHSLEPSCLHGFLRAIVRLGREAAQC